MEVSVGDSRQTGERGKKVAVTRLRQAIADGDMAPGQRLVEEELADTYGVTRAGVRAALLELTGEGLVERVPNRGARVRVVSVEEAVAITECRMVLEGLCAAKAAERVTPADVERLTEIVADMRSAVAGGEPLKYSTANQELHAHIRLMSGQDVAVGLLERLNAQIVRHQFRLALQAGRPQQSVEEHAAIADAVIAGDPAAAEGRARAHLESVIQALRGSQGD